MAVGLQGSIFAKYSHFASTTEIHKNGTRSTYEYLETNFILLVMHIKCTFPFDSLRGSFDVLREECLMFPRMIIGCFFRLAQGSEKRSLCDSFICVLDRYPLYDARLCREMYILDSVRSKNILLEGIYSPDLSN